MYPLSSQIVTILYTTLLSLFTIVASTNNNSAASSSSGQAKDNLTSVRHDKSSKLAGDPSDTGTLTITSEMDDDGKDNDYMGESDNC